MKNKKGFTLTELLVVIVILVSIVGTSIFGIEEISNQVKLRKQNDLITEVEQAADLYINTHEVYRLAILNNEVEEHCTRVYTLQNEGLLKTDLIDPMTNDRLPANLCVTSKLNEDGVIVSEFKYR